MSINQKILSQGIINNGLDILNYLSVDPDDIQNYLETVFSEKLGYPVPESFSYGVWFIPEQYQNLDVVNYIKDLCKTDVETQRVEQELRLFEKHKMLDVLKCMIYIVDTLRENNVVWGVGRGSSVASYCLHLIGVHKINSIKYELPIEEFFKENLNG